MTSEWKIPSLKQDILTGNMDLCENMDLNTIFFHQCESSYFHQRPIQRLVEIIKSTENVYEMVKSNVTEEGQNRARLIKII